MTFLLRTKNDGGERGGGGVWEGLVDLVDVSFLLRTKNDLGQVGWVVAR